METRKFNIGDEVVFIINDNYYGNEFHFKKLVEKHVVSDADDDYFSLDGDTLKSQRHRLYYQKSARCCDHSPMSSMKSLYHLEKDRELIDEKLAGYKNEYVTKQLENNVLEIDKLNSQIEYLKSCVEKLKTGDYCMRFGKLFDMKEYMEYVDSFIDCKIKS